MDNANPEGFSPLVYFSAGYDSAEKGLSRDACPLFYKAWPYYAWQDGFQWFHQSQERIANQSPEPYPVNEKTPMAQGEIAFAKGIAINDCPYEPLGSYAAQWAIGWRIGEKKAAEANEPEFRPLSLREIISNFFSNRG